MRLAQEVLIPIVVSILIVYAAVSPGGGAKRFLRGMRASNE